MKQLLQIIFYIGLSAISFSQSRTECDRIKKLAESAIRNDSLRTALTKLRALKICDPSLGTKVDDKILEVYKRIEAQRDSALIAKRQAELATKAEKIARNEAIKQKNNAIKEANRATALYWSSEAEKLTPTREYNYCKPQLKRIVVWHYSKKN